MRIIAGEHRGRRIDAPPGDKTRPMLDRVREALFSTVQDWVPDARVLDLFAGSGSLGLEALSRGAEEVRFVERAAPALEVLRRNVEALGLEEKSVVVRGNALLPASWSAGERPGIEPEFDPKFDIVFFDPPYPTLDDPMQRKDVLAAVQALMQSYVRPKGVLVFHAPARALEMLRFDREYARDLRTYGTSALCYLFQDASEPLGRSLPDAQRESPREPTEEA
jgi:16S rRNA (guanine(966)-N(2))-methyltransferase RsmD